MFTVKVRDSRNDAEVVFEAKGVSKRLYEERKDGDQLVGEVRCDTPTGDITYHIRGSAPANGSDDQTMFIMNENGATVAVYHL